jgi:hypothetical protein
MPAVAWFNPLDAVLGRTLGDLEGPLAAYGSWFGQPDGSSAEERVLRSLRESRLLARRLSQLQVRNNESFDGALVHVRRTAAPLSVGTLEIHLLGPHQSDVERSRAEWGVWLQEVGEAPLQMIARQAAPGATSALRASPSAVAVQPGERRPSGVPAIPSHILLVKEGASSVLLAGQATADEVLRGLASQGWTDSNGLARVSALDVPARAGARFGHGEFFKRVIADDYIVQGDTAMLAAAPEVIESLFAARAGSAFRLWIAATTHDETTERAAAVRALQQLVKDHAKANREATCTLLGARAASLEFPI